MPYLFSALKVGTTLSVIAAIVSEYFGGSREALGIYISQQAALFHFAEGWAAILVASFSGIVLYLVVALVERLVMPWHASIRNVQGSRIGVVRAGDQRAYERLESGEIEAIRSALEPLRERLRGVALRF